MLERRKLLKGAAVGERIPGRARSAKTVINSSINDGSIR